MQASKVLSDEAAAIYERAITGLMKQNMLLYFAYADFEEVTCIMLTKHCKKHCINNKQQQHFFIKRKYTDVFITTRK